MKNKEELITEYKKCEKEYYDLVSRYPWWNPHTNRSNPLPRNVQQRYKTLNTKLRTLKTKINMKGE